MAKKTRKKQVSDKIGVVKGKKMANKSNRFELNFNKEKFQVLGRKKQKGEHGNPGVSRGKAFEERKKTLGDEMRNFSKANKFVDRRLDERSTRLSTDEKMIKRFALERSQRYGGKNIYNLDDTETLTHYGQNLADIERVDDKPMSDDEDVGPLIDAETNFGGDDGEDKKSRKSLIDEMIAKSKQMKHEKQAQREQIQDLTDKLDEQWKHVLHANLMGGMISKSNDEKATKKEDQTFKEYDVLVKELMFEKKKGKAVDRLKSEQEIAKEEVERLERLENERQRRMRGEPETATQSKYSNPDDDETNLNFGRRNKVDRKTLRYGLDGKLAADNASEEDSDEEESNDEEFEEDDEEDEEEDSENVLPTVVTREQPSNGEMKSELPFVFELPKSYADFKSLLNQRADFDERATILDRMIKCHHPSLKEGNKQRLQKLFLFLLRYFDEFCTEGTGDDGFLQFLDKMTQFLFKLVARGGEYATKAVKALFNKHRKEFTSKQKRRAFPAFNVFAFFRLVPRLFPVSDFWHPIVTPSLLLASDVLTKSRVKTTNDVAKGLLQCTILVEYVKETKRVIPEILAFIRCFFAAIDTDGEYLALSTFSHFKKIFSWKTINKSNIADGKNEISLKDIFFEEKEINSENCLACAAKISRTLLNLWATCPSANEMFEPLVKSFERIKSKEVLEKDVKEELEKFLEEFNAKIAAQQRTYLAFPPKVAKEFKYFDPKIETNFNPERKFKNSKNQPNAERHRLQHKYKREYKSTVRELKRDNEFVAREQFRLKRKLDDDRREKTKRLMSSLMGQEADYKKMKRMNDKS